MNGALSLVLDPVRFLILFAGGCNVYVIDQRSGLNRDWPELRLRNHRHVQ